jgi:hypothetical protein
MSKERETTAAATPKPKIHLPIGAVAICGATGSGKSTMFYGSEHVRNVLIADMGSLGHRLYAKGQVVTVDPTAKDSPVKQVLDAGKRWRDAGELFLLDSFTTLVEQQIVWTKATLRHDPLHQRDYQTIVGQMRDTILILAQTPCFVIFNTAPGGIVRNADGTQTNYPKGSLVGLPALTGIGANSESMLARFPSSWVVFKGWPEKGIPRGFLLPNDDLRPQEAAQYTPIKDPLRVIQAGEVEGAEGGAVKLKVDPFRDPSKGAPIDEMLERIALKFPAKS